MWSQPLTSNGGLVLLVALLNFTPLSSAKPRVPGPYHRYHTEPTLIPSIIRTYRSPSQGNYSDSDLAPGYIFIAPHVANKGYGPQIVDQYGELVWHGFGTVNKFEGRKTYAMNLYACDYMGEIGNHLCYSEARPEGHDVGIRTAGANRVFNQHYEQVGPDYGIAGDFTFPNPHEFNMLPGGESFLQAVYEFHKLDLRPYKGQNPGYVFNGCFQEVDVRTEKELFRWCFLDHHPIWNTHIFLHSDNNKENISSPVGGAGIKDDPWDFMHLNAVDKNEEGDYIVSGRHLNSIIKVAGKRSRSGKNPGETIWRVGGHYSDFEISSDEPGANFSMQHHCRFAKTTKNETVITLFNNANNGITAPTANYSSAIQLTVNNETMKARLDHIYKQPQGRLAYAQGSMQLLPNKNVLVGWGARPQWTEFTQNGSIIQHAGAYADAGGKLSNYRTYKFPWVGKPNTNPKLVAYCRSCAFSNRDPLVAYVSWNGATEVVSWRFFVKFSDKKGTWYPVGTFPKDGFETQAKLSTNIFDRKASFAPYVAVEALDKDEQVLARAQRKTFVPNRQVRHMCKQLGCKAPAPAAFYYIKSNNYADSCGLRGYNWVPQTLLLVLVMLVFEGAEWLMCSFLAPLRYHLPRDYKKYDFIPNGKLGDR